MSTSSKSPCRSPRHDTVPRHLNYAVQAGLLHETAWYVDGDGNLDIDGLMAAFQRFFREHSEHWVQRFDQYHEAGPQLLLQASLQRVINGGSRIEREYSLGRGRVDLLIVWPAEGGEQRFVVECKIRRGDLAATITEGIAQTRRYMDRSGAEAGTLSCLSSRPGHGRRRFSDATFRRSRFGVCELQRRTCGWRPSPSTRMKDHPTAFASCRHCARRARYRRAQVRALPRDRRGTARPGTPPRSLPQTPVRD